MNKRIGAAVAAFGLTTALTGVAIPAANAHSTGIHDNCTNLNKRYPNGLGTRFARDRTSGTPVTTFKRNTDLYWAAERHNGTLDADNDRIACEKR